MVAMRLSRLGKKQRPFYRIVVMDKGAPRDGRYLENLGTFDPRGNENPVRWKAERVRYWLEKGAEPSLTVKNLLKKYYKAV